MQQQSALPDARRQFERTPVKAHAFIHCRGHFQPAKVVGYSQSGLQLSGTFGLFKGDAIEIELISGTRVAGQVAWSLGAQTGVGFDAILPTNHPVMIELALRQPSEPDESNPMSDSLNHVLAP